MQHVLQHSPEWPNWQADAARRLNISMVVSALLVAGLLSVLRITTVDLFFPLMEIVVNIVSVDEPEAPPAPVPEVVSEPLPQAVEQTAEPEPALESVAESPPPTVDAPAEPQSQSVPNAIAQQVVDWETEKAQAVQDAVDAMERTASVNPNFDKLRQEAAIKFRPSRAPIKKEIWDYVEKDQAGRTVLRYGNFYQVLDDPRLFNRDAFLTFQRHMVFGMYRKYVPKELPWVREIRRTHAYLRIQEDRRNGIFESE
jgi:hypothetical protein